jgi:hypothetical protein
MNESQNCGGVYEIDQIKKEYSKHILVDDDKCHLYTCPDETGTLQPCGGSPYKAVYTFSEYN